MVEVRDGLAKTVLDLEEKCCKRWRMGSKTWDLFLFGFSLERETGQMGLKFGFDGRNGEKWLNIY